MNSPYENIAIEYAYAYDHEIHSTDERAREYWTGKRFGIQSATLEFTGRAMYPGRAGESDEYRYYNVWIGDYKASVSIPN